MQDSGEQPSISKKDRLKAILFWWTMRESNPRFPDANRVLYH